MDADGMNEWGKRGGTDASCWSWPREVLTHLQPKVIPGKENSIFSPHFEDSTILQCPPLSPFDYVLLTRGTRSQSHYVIGRPGILQDDWPMCLVLTTENVAVSMCIFKSVRSEHVSLSPVSFALSKPMVPVSILLVPHLVWTCYIHCRTDGRHDSFSRWVVSYVFVVLSERWNSVEERQTKEERDVRRNMEG